MSDLDQKGQERFVVLFSLDWIISGSGRCRLPTPRKERSRTGTVSQARTPRAACHPAMRIEITHYSKNSSSTESQEKC